MKKQVLTILFSTCFALSLTGQTLKQFEKAAKNAIKKQEYGEALYYLDKIQEIDSTKIDLQYHQAEAARMYNALFLAEKRYLQVLNSKRADRYPHTRFWLANVHKMLGRYDQAIEGFETYLKNNPDSTHTNYLEAHSQIQQCLWAKDLIRFEDEDLKVLHLDSTVNSPFSDFAPVPYGDSLLFSSLRFTSPDGKTEQKFSKVLKTSKEGSSSALFDLGFPESEIHTAHVAFNKDQNRVYFNKCYYLKGNIIQCELFKRDKTEWGWTVPKKLNSKVNLPNSTSTNPNIGYDEDKDKEILFFISDRLGGKGGTDIWWAYLDQAGDPGEVFNLQTLNTPADEFSPFFHNYTQTLYFSSNGLKNLGGHDIYKSEWREGKWKPADHTGYPLNSSYNDVYFSLNKDGSIGYFSSNREGTLFLEKELSACCYDVFKAEFNSYLLDLKIITLLKDEDLRQPLEGVNVSVYEIFDNAEKLVPPLEVPIGNQHIFRVKSNKEYRIEAEKPGFFPDSIHLSTEKAPAGLEIIREVELRPPNLEVRTFEKTLNQPMEGVSVELYQLGPIGNKTFIPPLRPSEKNKHFFPLSLGQKYLLISKKSSYEGVEEIFTTIDMNIQEPTLVKNVILQQEQNIVLRRLRPFPLYFDNDHPNPRSQDTVTEFSFPDMLREYKQRKVEFKRGYSRGLTGKAKKEAEDLVEHFFENEIDSAFSDFIIFTDAVLERLSFGRSVEISVQAYTSPLASEDYNLRLSKRRISSMLNFYRTYKNGAMKEYVDNGKLSIEMIPHGESQASKEVSDNPNDKRNSVYGLMASKERRVVIKEVNTRRRIDNT